ncbi:CD320 antigen [Pseudorca crassidens]|uniref:CD320 antigen n=1 Tax=Pseudorca crassidens TaxID=82174 RepID=UPI00352C53BD
MSGWMAGARAQRATALGLALRVLLSFGLGLEAAPTSIPAWSLTQAPGPSAASCPPTNFQCRSDGLCVPLTWRCDVDKDCLDGSDEEECSTEPCAQDGQCKPPTGSPCSCDSIDDCPDGINKNVLNCGHQPCPEGELRCPLGGSCIPRTWLCDGHPDCSDSSDELGCGTKTLQEGSATSVGTPVTLESVTYLRNATVTSVGDRDSVQSGNRSAYGIIAAAVVLSVGLAAAILFMWSRLCAQGRLSPLGLLVSVKGSLQSERTASVL